jgi:hypothetical protein
MFAKLTRAREFVLVISFFCVEAVYFWAASVSALVRRPTPSRGSGSRAAPSEL